MYRVSGVAGGTAVGPGPGTERPSQPGLTWRTGTSAGVEILWVRVVEEPSHPFQFRTLIDRPRRPVVTFIGIDHVHVRHRSFLKHGLRSVNRHSLVQGHRN